jgi:LuxR family transcriptional regulator, maltose regulon positive regulatory protein
MSFASEVVVFSHAIPLTQRSIDTRAFLERTALIEAALARQPRGLLVVTAPSGYGKSVLARHIGAHWSAQQVRPLRVWPLRSTTTLNQALRSFCEIFGFDDRPSSLNPDIAADTALEALALCADPGVLVVDLDGAPPVSVVKSLAAQVLTEFVQQGRALVACRNPWLLSLERIALSAPVQIFEAADLAFDADALMQLHGLDVAHARRWLEVSEGWPLLCGPRLPVAHDSLSDEAATLATLLAERITDYLEHELLSALPARDVQLLMHASIFEAVEPGMLEALGSDISWSRFNALQDIGLPQSIANSTRDRIVLHPVLRAFLQRRLQDRSPAIYHSLHRRAALGYAAAHNHRLALAHATRTNDPIFVDQITERSGGWRVSMREGLRALDRGIAEPAISAQFPKAQLARTYWLAQTGRLDEAEHLLRHLQQTEKTAALRADQDTIAAVIAVYRDTPLDEARIAGLNAHTQSLPGEAIGLGAATVVAAMLNNAALYERAAATSRAATLEAAATGSRYVEFYGQWECGIALHGLGHVTDALREYARATALAEELLGESSNEARIIGLGAAHAAYLAGDDDLAERLAGDLTGLYRLHAWFEPYARALEVATALSRMRGDGKLETHVLQSFADLAESRSLPRLGVMVLLAYTQQALAEGDMETAARHHSAALHQAETQLPASTPQTQRVLAPLHLEGIRIELLAGRLREGGWLAERSGPLFAGSSDGSIALEYRLFMAYLDVHAREFRSASARLSQCVHQAHRHGLLRPLRNNANFIGELAECVRSRALPFDSGVLNSVLQMSLAESATLPDLRPRTNLSHNGRMLLTEREMDILHFLADGLSSKEMARRLRISEGTVKTHRKHLYEKLNAGLRSQAITRARELGLL